MTPRLRQPLLVTGVLLLHVAGLWALGSGLLRRAVEQVLPVALLAAEVEAPVVPAVTPVDRTEPRPAPVSRPQPAPTARPAPADATAAPGPAPVLAAAVPGDNAPAAPAAVTAPPPAAAAARPEAVATARPGAQTSMAAAPATAPPPPAKLELPVSDAAYLQNPRPPYPPLSKRLREEGEVIVRVLIGPDGQPQRAELLRSSGFDRLDRVAVETTMRWRYVPGKRGGVPEAMWAEVPLEFKLESARP